ncbi:solute carrier family 35 member B1-like [Biomphalaria glabrata]|uniref:Solute carrier family 35 member B1-like n=2 Tax=Biomphalaria TaxID=6525 RepID=A0A2C9JED1_BIOGL|nr:solute carrier family 35 member B1-like [Biomphalaria glabrata]KAK0059449.1 solute carrier family 35 member B1 [Biomphalaria pfeifferi]
MSNIDVNQLAASAKTVEIVDLKQTTIPIMGEGSTKKLLICAAGIFFCYFYYGILQEKITKGKYGEGEQTEKFHYTLSLVFVQCVINALYAKIAMTIFTSKERDSTPNYLYAICSLTYLGAMLASNHSLQHVSYPTQVLGKSIKPIPVMVLGVLFARKRYPLAKYFCVLLIVMGVAMFMYKDKGSTKKTEDQPFIGVGEFLLLLSLTLDGLTGASQDRMKSFHQTSANNMMLHINVFSVLWLAIGLLATGELFEFIGFASRHPIVLFNMISFSIASALGQMFIFITVTTFGPLTCSIITTTRKFFTILASVIIFQNPMSAQQWAGTSLVFVGLGLDSVYGKEKKNKS